jgi:thymidylate synthase (FAD)
MKDLSIAYNYLSSIIEDDAIGNNFFSGNKRKIKQYANENARYILPNACETKIMLSMNARSLLNLFSLRTCGHAQLEIRRFAQAVLCESYKQCPTAFKNAGPACVRGKCPEGKRSCGHPKKPLWFLEEDEPNDILD